MILQVISRQHYVLHLDFCISANLFTCFLMVLLAPHSSPDVVGQNLQDWSPSLIRDKVMALGMYMVLCEYHGHCWSVYCSRNSSIRFWDSSFLYCVTF